MGQAVAAQSTGRFFEGAAFSFYRFGKSVQRFGTFGAEKAHTDCPTACTETDRYGKRLGMAYNVTCTSTQSCDIEVDRFAGAPLNNASVLYHGHRTRELFEQVDCSRDATRTRGPH
ncbi:hypothetical protein A5630_15505 [Mycolicibacterium mucogenicum]|uniref:Uncharacterized protein n=1 Tax=Mycolicibacterium mucogenicum TaxID=56689 RepID=A0A1A3HB53_MYCMU|nr:hypothetical protein A5630_15505 [Mycolicibacterium mucogenicum]